MQKFQQDIRFALRQLRKSPGFTLTAILTLALGIGANTAIFSVMNAVLLRTLPVRDAAQLVYLRPTDQAEGASNTGDSSWSVSEAVFEQMRRESKAFTDVMMFVPLSFNKVAVRIGDQPQEANGDMVSGNFFSGLGVGLERGRAFTPADEKSHAQVAVVSDPYWAAHFARNPSALGQTLFVRGVPFTIIGVTAPGFQGVERAIATDFWIPLQDRPELNAWGMSATNGETMYGSPKWWCVMMIGRLRPGLTPEQAQVQTNPVFQAAAYAPLGEPKAGVHKVELRLYPARGIAVANEYYKKPLTLLMAMVALVLVIVCSNVAMLLVARNATRQREFSLRLALGAQRWPLFRQLLTESLLLVAAGSALGWLFALAATRVLAQWSSLEMDLTPDHRVLLFSLGISLVAALVFGLAPLRGAVRVPVGLVLKATGVAASQDREKALGGKIVVALQMALCVVLLVVAGLLLRSLLNYQNHDLGIRLRGLLVFGVSPQNLRSDAQSIQFYESLLARLRTVPGVQSATLMENRIGSGWSDNNLTLVDGKSPSGTDEAFVRSNTVSSDFFHTLGIPILAGRDFTGADTPAAPHSAIINQTFATKYMPGVNPIGHHIGGAKPEEQMTIVGLVKDSKYAEVDEHPLPMAWYPYTQSKGIGDMHVELHTGGDPEALLPTIRRVVQQIDPNLPLQKPMTQRAQFEQSYADQAMFSRLATFFGALAALLVAIGLYGTLAYRVSRRTMEIGVRMALGSQRQGVLWMILRESAWLALAGIALGLPIAFFTAHLLESMLFGVSTRDPLSFAGALAGVLAVAAFAAWLPARRAASVDPMQALRMQ